jgi:hypothetical protein
MEEKEIDRLIAELDEYYPGSKKKRRPLNPQAKKPKVKEEGILGL